MANQHKPLPPDGFLRPLIIKYYLLRRTDKQIAELIRTHRDFKPDIWGISDTSVKRARQRFRLKKTRAQCHNLDSIADHVQEIRKKFPTRGARKITDELWVRYRVAAPRELVELYLHLTEPESVRQRKRGRLVRRVMWSAGVNDVWSQDQHDKWRRFGLFLHVSVDLHSGYINWLRIWWTNRNPRLITSYFLERARDIGGIPLLTQSDPGTENNGVANAQTLLRRRLDPRLVDFVQHRFMHKKKNIKPEILWSVLRGDFSYGFEIVLQQGLDEDVYNPDDDVEWFVFRWLAIPWLQGELDSWRELQNNTARRANKRKILPHGPPALILERPDQYDTADFKVNVPPAFFDDVQSELCPADNVVFQLVPPAFEVHIGRIFHNELGYTRDDINEDTFWDIYKNILGRFRAMPRDLALDEALSTARHQNDYEDVPPLDRVEVLPGKAFRDGDVIVGAGGTNYEYVGALEDPEIPAAVLEEDSDLELFDEPEPTDDGIVDFGNWLEDIPVALLSSDEED